MKKKALITATAVLLVAVMCLATASYAWFTGGEVSTVTMLNIGVTAGESGIEIAAAKINNNSYSAGAFTTSPIAEDTFRNYGYLPVASTGQLTAVSTDGVLNTNNNFTFVETTYANNIWTASKDENGVSTIDGTEYVLISFYAKNGTNEEKKVTFDFTSSLITGDTASADFMAAAKVGYSAVAINKEVVTGDNLTSLGSAVSLTNLTTYDLQDEDEYYQPMIGLEASAKRLQADEGTHKVGDFVPNSTGENDFAEEQNNTTWTAQELTIGANSTVLITFALWIEGMDNDCAGSWNVDRSDITLSLNKVA